MTRTHAIAIGLVTVLMGGAAHTAAADHRAAQAPRSQDVQAPRDQDEVQAPRGQDDVQAPRGQDEVQAPRGAQEAAPTRR